MGKAGDGVKAFARRRGRVEGAGRWRAALDYLFLDHAFLRHAWTNMAPVAPGVWRSNQPTHRRLAALKARGLRTVLTLRGSGERSFHRFERESCEALGLGLVSVALSARRAPPRDEVLALFEAFRTVERPVLIHCKSGADRTGFAAALFLLAEEGTSVAEARRQLSWRFFHLPRSRAGVLGHILSLYEARLREGPVGVEEWFRTDYDPEAAQAGFAR